MNKRMTAILIVVVAVIIFMPVWLLQAALSGWVLSVLWNWFIPIVFEGMPRLTIGSAVAVALIAGMLTKQIQPTVKEEPDDKRIRQAVQLLYPFVCLLFGWVVRWWFFT